MIGGGLMRNGLLLLAALGALAACSMELPSFLGREGTSEGFYNVRGEPPPEPRSVPVREAVLERGLHGMIVRVRGEAPTQGFYAARLAPVSGGEPDAAGIISFEFVAVPPSAPQAIGPARTRELSAAVFFPSLALKDVRGFRIAGAGSVQALVIR
jgi:hypothetical protein